MTPKEYLSQIRYATCLIKNKQHQIEKLKSSLEYKAVCYDSVKVQSSNNRTNADIICEIADFENELNEQIKALIQIKSEVIKTIDKITDIDYIQLLYMRYIDMETFKSISVNLNYSYRWTLKLHGKALLEIGKILKEDM